MRGSDYFAAHCTQKKNKSDFISNQQNASLKESIQRQLISIKKLFRLLCCFKFSKIRIVKM